ncbi:unnamed protein product, partial [Adineta ricciae]
MASRSTKWRNRQRVQDLFNRTPFLIDAPAFSNDHESSHSFNQDNNSSSGIQLNTNDNSSNTTDEKPSSSPSINLQDFLNSLGVNTDTDKLHDIQADPNAEEETNTEEEDFLDLSSEASVYEVAAVLIVLKTRHKLSNRCLDHFCQLMRLLKVQNVPKNSSHIKCILSPTLTTDATSPAYFCAKCNKLSAKETNCTNVECNENKGFTTKPPVFVRLPLKTQIQDVLSRFPALYFQQQSSSNISDSSNITEGLFYKKIVEQEGDGFISLVMNVDGIEISKSSKSSLWVITFVINELKKPDRFRMQNVLVGGIGAGVSKPSRQEMAAYLQPIINELLLLENENRYTMGDGTHSFLKVFLIAGSLDKPAQALVQNLTEINGAYGCGKCLIKGITVPIKPGYTHKLRVFPVRKQDVQPKLRNNFSYDVKMAIPESFRPKEKTARRDYMCGYLGECHLRDLRFFDVG